MSRDWSELVKITQGSPLVVKEVYSVDQAVAVRGDFELPPLASLTADDQVFVMSFLRTQGSIKEMEQLFGVSYPTIKARLARINEKLGIVELNPPASGQTRQEILAMLDRGEITSKEAIERLKK